MSVDLSSAESTAKQYVGSSQPLRRLGWGVSGVVFATGDNRTAVKVHHYAEGHATEVEAYRRLAKAKLFRIDDIIIPRMRAFDSSLRAIQMDFVSPPFLLDFAGVMFKKPDFEPHVWEEWKQGIFQKFGPNQDFAYRVLQRLKKLSIYYLDLRESNLNLRGHPRAEPWPVAGNEETDEPY